MPKFESDLTNKEYNLNNQSRNMQVPDFSNPNKIDFNELSEFKNRLDKAEKNAYVEKPIEQFQKERLSDGAKRRIEMLCGMLRLTRIVKFNENEFLLQTLKSGEIRESLSKSVPFDGTFHFAYEIRRQLLSRSLSKISGIDVCDFIGSDDINLKLKFIDELDEDFLNRLYIEYNELTKESREKYSIKTEEEVKEVIEDLKK